MDKIQKVKELRAAGKVERCHTTPHFGSYTVGQHSFDVAMLILTLHPSPNFRLVRAALYHDCHERWIGDVPTPTKETDPAIRRSLKKLERQCERALGIAAHLHAGLTKEEKRWLKAADRVELWLWAIEQINMGNQEAYTIKRDLERFFEDLPEELHNFVHNYMWEIRSDEFPK